MQPLLFQRPESKSMARIDENTDTLLDEESTYTTEG